MKMNTFLKHFYFWLAAGNISALFIMLIFYQKFVIWDFFLPVLCLIFCLDEYFKLKKEDNP